jgi:hypothetical protein
MKTRIVCLANSFKEHGRCLAGIELNSKNEVVYDNLIPKWIRPVCKTEHDEIPTNLVSMIKPLDIIEFEITEIVPKGFQSENVLFDEKSLKVLGVFEKEEISNLGINSRNNLFGNNGKALAPESVEDLNHSLMFISVSEFEILEVKYENSEHPKIRLKFKYNSFNNDLSITDPIFLEKYKNNRNILKNVNQIYLVISLGILFENWHSKLVACIIY